jgi:hypothetical protein
MLFEFRDDRRVNYYVNVLMRDAPYNSTWELEEVTHQYIDCEIQRQMSRGRQPSFGVRY